MASIRKAMQLFLTVGVFLFITVSYISCNPASLLGPKVGDLSGATDAEISQACKLLASAKYDYWTLGMSNAVLYQGRLLEIAAEIHTLHPGPEQTKEYCVNR